MGLQTSIGFLIGLTLALMFGSVTEANTARVKRQAPNINVHQIPKTSFTCADKKVGEYYADTETGCQVYHVCIPGMHNKMSLMSFVCPNGTIFNQATRVCSPYDRVDCRLALQFYETIHGNLNSRRTDYEADADYDNYVPPAPRATAPPRQPPAPPRQQPGPPRPQPALRNTVPPAEPEVPARAAPRFRSGANQFRGPQARSAQTPAPAGRQPLASAPARQPVTAPPAAARPAPQVVRPGAPGFRPAIAGRPSSPVTQTPAVVPPRVTLRPVVSTSTSAYNYEYEYEYDYEDEVADEGASRTKRDVLSALASYDYDSQGLDVDREPPKTGFSCLDKIPGGVYADMETDCEMFHICVPLGKHKILDYKVFCANDTAFDQETGSCTKKNEFKCENSEIFYHPEKLNKNAAGKKPTYKKSTSFKSKIAIPAYKAK